MILRAARLLFALTFLGLLFMCAGAQAPARAQGADAQAGAMPATRWMHRPRHTQWNQAALEALRTHAEPLIRTVPADIARWCPAYDQARAADRRAFWLAFLSALAKHESTYRQSAVGGGNRWFGLLQISPGTARAYGCAARSGNALTDGGANLSCALRIMAVTVRRDGVIHGRTTSGRWLGVSADWGPLRSQTKRADIASYTLAHRACRQTLKQSRRPQLRPS